MKLFFKSGFKMTTDRNIFFDDKRFSKVKLATDFKLGELINDLSVKA